MKKTRSGRRRSWTRAMSALCLALALISPGASASPPVITWSPAVRVSLDLATNNLPQVLVAHDTITIVWFGIDEFGTLDLDGVEVSRSTDGGATFSDPLSLLPFEVCLSTPLAARGGNALVIAVGAVGDTTYGTYILRSPDGGASWEAPRFLRRAAYPTAVAAEANFFTVETFSPDSRTLVFHRSTDAGATWTNPSGSAPRLNDMIIRDGVIHAVGPASSRILQEVGYYSSRNQGSNWFGPDYLSSEDVTRSERGAIAMNDRGELFAAWLDDGENVTVRASRNGGIFWGGHSILSSAPGTVNIDIAAAAEFSVVTWDRDTGGTGMVRIRASDDFGRTFGAEANPVNGASAAEPSVVLVDSVIHLTWHEHRGDTCEVYYRRGTMPHNPDAVTRPPQEYRLEQNYPNPFNGRTVITYQVPAEGHVSLILYDVLGRAVRTLVDGVLPIGRYTSSVDGDGLPSGVYLYRLRTASYTETKKLTVMR